MPARPTRSTASSISSFSPAGPSIASAVSTSMQYSIQKFNVSDFKVLRQGSIQSLRNCKVPLTAEKAGPSHEGPARRGLPLSACLLESATEHAQQEETGSDHGERPGLGHPGTCRAA